jgi:protein-disulfide isomerase
MLQPKALDRRRLILSSSCLCIGFGSIIQAHAQDSDHNHDHGHEPIKIAPLATWLSLSEIKRQNLVDGKALTNDMIMGSLSAKNTLIVYVSLSCGHCANWYAKVLPMILETYVKPKKLKIVFRELLTNPAAYGLSGTMIARCLSQKSKSPKDYFETLSAFFEGQNKALTTGRMGDALIKTKERTSSNQDQLLACMAENKLYDQVNATLEHNANSEKITHTPWFIVNDKSIESPDGEALLKALAKL